jgi:succinate dehydrogenase/fumarate reductase-like Fe-S protein
MDIEQGLRITSNDLLRTLDRLHELETRKRVIKPGTAKFRRVAEEVERLAATVLVQTQSQTALAETVTQLPPSVQQQLPPIEETPVSRDLQVILSEWRDAERRLAAAADGSTEHEEARTAADRLRTEYRRTYEEATRPPND